MMNSIKTNRYYLLPVALLLLITACRTGIEGTKTIKMSRSERRELLPGAEERLAARIHPDTLGQWKSGKKFVISDNKASLLLESPALSVSAADTARLAGLVIGFERVTPRPTPGGDTVAILEFAGPDGIYRYNTSRKLRDALHTLTGLDVAMMIDLDLVSKADSILSGRKVWTMSRLWYDESGNSLSGRKFEPVTITAVEAGNMIFPLKVRFRDDAGRSSSMYMNVNNASGIGAESRTFPSLFSLTDPKLDYPSVSQETWENICNGRVALGMTKDECRLALGNPSEVDAGYNWSSVIDVWGYRDGTFLQFQDGLLINFRH